ncbi:MAG: hypothetical protein ACREBC_28740, partial [Pyrinomonadaceae bacterium]
MLGLKASTYQRFRDILINTRFCFEVFGVIRSEVLRSTSLIDSYYGSDKVILAELALRGAFHIIPRPLFYRRCHAEQSAAIVERTARERWIGSDSRMTLPEMKMPYGVLPSSMAVPNACVRPGEVSS